MGVVPTEIQTWAQGEGVLSMGMVQGKLELGKWCMPGPERKVGWGKAFDGEWACWGGQQTQEAEFVFGLCDLEGFLRILWGIWILVMLECFEKRVRKLWNGWCVV